MQILLKSFEMNLGYQLFNDYWHMICHRRELPMNNDFIKFKTPLGDIVLFNDEGSIVAFDNRCAHRGTSIYLDNWGNQPNTCKYHGWTYRGGSLIIPNIDQFASCNIDSADLNKFSLEWCGDFLFLGILPKLALYDQLNGTAEYIENISFNIDGRHDFNFYDYECYWPLAVENALESYHIDFVHPKTLATLQLESGTNEFFAYSSLWKAPISNKRINRQLSGLKKFFNIDYGYDGYMSIYLFPFTMISSTYGFSYSVQNFFPSKQRDDRTHFMSRLLTCHLGNNSAQGIIKNFFDSSATVNRIIFEEDHEICKLMPQDDWHSDPLIYISDLEIKIAHFRKLCKAYKDNA